MAARKRGHEPAAGFLSPIDGNPTDEVGMYIEQTNVSIEADVNADQQEFEFAALPKLRQHTVDVVIELSIVFLKLVDLRLARRAADGPETPSRPVLDGSESGELLSKPVILRSGLYGKHPVVAQRSSEFDDLSSALTFQNYVLFTVVRIGLRSGARQPLRDLPREDVLIFSWR